MHRRSNLPAWGLDDAGLFTHFEAALPTLDLPTKQRPDLPSNHSLITLLTASPTHPPPHHKPQQQLPSFRKTTTIMKTAAAVMLLLPLAAAISHSSPSSYPYSASFGARVRFPTTFLATVPSHSDAAFTTSTKHHQHPRRVAVIRGGAAATAGVAVPAPASKSGDGNKGSATSTATFNLSTFMARVEGGRVASMGRPVTDDSLLLSVRFVVYHPRICNPFHLTPIVSPSLPLSIPLPPVKNILGAGVLSLPSGIGAFSKNPLALIPAAALTLGLGSLSAYCFTLIARVCALNKVQSYG